MDDAICSTRRTFLKAAAATLAGFGTVNVAQGRSRRFRHSGPIASAAFTCDFRVSNDLPPQQIVQILERDRLQMSARPGFVRKHVPLRVNPVNGSLLSGGRYLFHTVQQALTYRHWVENDFILDGTKFFDRPYIHDPDCHVWAIADRWINGCQSYQVVTRMERWSAPAGAFPQNIHRQWPLILDLARRRCLSSVWLLENLCEHMVGLVYFRRRAYPADPADHGDPQKVAEASLSTLESLSPLGDVFDDYGFTKTFDRTHLVMTAWFPFVSGDHGCRPLWPNSPPLPQPILSAVGNRS